MPKSFPYGYKVLERTTGYIRIKVGNYPGNKKGWILEHRYLINNHLGRYLNSNEIVHHKNEIRSDNRISNLNITTRKAHSVIHKSGIHGSKTYRSSYNDSWDVLISIQENFQYDHPRPSR